MPSPTPLIDQLELGYLYAGDSVTVGSNTFALGVDPDASPRMLPSDAVTDWFLARRLNNDPFPGGSLGDPGETAPERDTSWVAPAIPRDDSDREYNDRGLRLLADGEPFADAGLTADQRSGIVAGFLEIAARRALTLIPMLDDDSIEMGTFRAQSDLAQARPGGQLEEMIQAALSERFGSQMSSMPALQAPDPSPAPTALDEPSSEAWAEIVARANRTPRQEAAHERAQAGVIGAEDVANMVLDQVRAYRQVPLGLACRAVQVGIEQPGQPAQSAYRIGISLDWKNPEHTRFLADVQAKFPAEWLRVMNQPAPPQMRGRPAVSLDL